MKFGSSIDESQQRDMYSDLSAREQLFAVDLDNLGCIDTHPYSVRLVSCKTPAQPPIKYPPAARRWLNEYVEELIRVGLARHVRQCASVC